MRVPSVAAPLAGEVTKMLAPLSYKHGGVMLFTRRVLLFSGCAFLGACGGGSAPSPSAVVPPAPPPPTPPPPPPAAHPLADASFFNSRYATTNGPKLFVKGVWIQEPPTFAGWKARGINTLVTPHAAFGGGGYSEADYNAEAERQGMLQIRGPGTTGAADALNEKILAWSLEDEPDGQGDKTPAQLQATIAEWRALSRNKPISLNYTSGNLAYQNADAPTTRAPYFEYFGLQDVAWHGGDIYPDQQANGGTANFLFSTYNMGSLQPYTTTVVGAATKNVFKGPYRGASHTAVGKAHFQFLSTGRVEGNNRPSRPERFRALAWSAIINGVSGLHMFPQYVSHPYVQNDSDPAVLAEMERVFAKIAILEGLSGNVLMDTVNGGRRPFTIRHCAPAQGDPNASEASIQFSPPTGNQLPGPFEGCEIVVGSETYRLVLNLLNSPQSLTDAAWALTKESFGPYEVKCFRASAATSNLFL